MQPKATRGVVASFVWPWLLALCCAAVALPQYQQQQQQRQSFNATVVMHTPLGDMGMTASQIIAVNLRAYDALLAEPSLRHTDVVVFPESGTGFLFVPRDMIPSFCEPVPYQVPSDPTAPLPVVPCDPAWANGSTPHLSWLACAARRANAVILVDYCEQGTGADGQPRLFNVVVGVDGQGRFLGKYRKVHISGTGPYLSQPEEADPVAFPTPFGVPIGVFVCYDVWFREPQSALIRQGVRHFAAPSQLGNGAPFWSVSQIHGGWSMARGVTVFGSGSLAAGSIGVYVNGSALGVYGPIPGPTYSPAHFAITCGVPVDGEAPPSAWGPCVQTVPPVTPPGARATPLLHQQPPLRSHGSRLALPQGKQHRQHRDFVVGDRKAAAAAAAAAATATTLGSLGRQNVTTYPEACTYGPAQYNLNFTAACQVLETQAVGERYQLAANFTNDYGVVRCAADLTLGAVSAAQSLGRRLALLAFVIVVEPTVDTPTATTNAGCALVECADPRGERGCLELCPDDDPWCPLWNVTLRYRSVRVEASFTGNYTNATSVVYPLGLVRRGTDILPLGPSEVRFTAEDTSYALELEADGSTGGSGCSLCQEPSYSFGFWATSLYKSLF